MSCYFFATIHRWSWTRIKKGEFAEDESYEWRDAALDRRLGQEYEKQNTSFSSERFDTNKESIIIGSKVWWLEI